MAALLSGVGRSRPIGALLATTLLVGTAVGSTMPNASAAPVPERSTGSSDSSAVVYAVTGAASPQDRTAVTRTGVDVLGTIDGQLTVTATDEQLSALRAKGFGVERVNTSDPRDFPSGYEGYHDYDELNAELGSAADEHGEIVEVSSIGTSFRGREIPLVKISDNVGQDENEPEVLFDCQQHAREILTREMCLRIVNRLSDSYADDPEIAKYVDTREIYVVPTMNPDGAAYDIASGEFQMWRKNRQGEGTDLNRNWAYKWGCCGGSSDVPSDETYRGESAFSAPETAALRDFVNSRVVDGEQQITANIDFHSYGELVLWPYGYTYDETAPGLSSEEEAVFREFGTEMASTNGYDPQQSSDLYITDGDISDWMWGEHKVWSYAFEMYGGWDGFYPPDSAIEEQTARNDAAVDLVLEYADCLPRFAGQSCE